MFSKDRLLDVLENAHQQETAFADSLSQQQGSPSGQPDAWSAKDIIAHLAVWRMRQLDRLEAAARGETLPSSGPDFDDINREIFEAHRDKTWDEVRAMLDEAHQRTLDTVRLTPEDELTRAPQPGEPTRWRSVLNENISHAMTHLWQFHLEHGQPEQAVALQEAISQSLKDLDDADFQGVGLYNLACVYSLTGRHKDAIRTLGEALKLSPRLTDWSKEDSDLAALREDPDYQALYAQ